MEKSTKARRRKKPESFPTKPQEEKRHPDPWEQDLNPHHLGGQNIGRYSVTADRRERTAAEIKDLRRRFSDFTNDELQQIPIVPTGTQLKQGAVYLDLRHPESGPITAEGGIIAAKQNWFTPKAEVPYEHWNRLLDRLCPAVSKQEYGAYADGSNRELSESMIDETLKESFPASDPPAWTTGRERHRK